MSIHLHKRHPLHISSLYLSVSQSTTKFLHPVPVIITLKLERKKFITSIKLFFLIWHVFFSPLLSSLSSSFSCGRQNNPPKICQWRARMEYIYKCHKRDDEFCTKNFFAFKRVRVRVWGNYSINVSCMWVWYAEILFKRSKHPKNVATRLFYFRGHTKTHNKLIQMQNPNYFLFVCLFFLSPIGWHAKLQIFGSKTAKKKRNKFILFISLSRPFSFYVNGLIQYWVSLYQI